MRGDGLNAAHYRESEEHFWNAVVGARPEGREIELPTVGARVRLLVHGTGPTLLFVHGGPNAAPKWASLVARLPGFCCALLERPGCGLSEPAARRPAAVRPYVVRVVSDALEALGEEPAAIVASSFGSFAALAFAFEQRWSGRMVHLGCPALVPGSRTPLANLAAALPGIGRVVQRLQPPTTKRTMRSFERLGHSPETLRSGENTAFVEWYTALLRDTDTRINDNRLFGQVRPRDALKAEELARIDAPMSFLWGENDPFGGAEVARRLVEALPNAALELVPGAGHLPWLDDPDRAAAHVRAAVVG